MWIDPNIYFPIALALAFAIAVAIKWPEIRDAGKPEHEARAEAKRHYDEYRKSLDDNLRPMSAEERYREYLAQAETKALARAKAVRR